MNYGRLVDYFKGFGYKRLKPVEIDPSVSHGHEFNGIAQFKSLFGLERQSFTARVLYLSDTEDDILAENVEFTWYDARENTPGRTEHRLYYRESALIEKAASEDLMVVALNKERKPYDLTVMIARKGDTAERQLAWLFGFALDSATEVFTVKEDEAKQLDYFSTMLLDRAGIPIEVTSTSVLEKLLSAFPSGFPKTKVFSAFARELVPDVDIKGNSDDALMAWMEAEENAFLTFEHYLLQQKLDDGFASVDDFLAFSLHIHNRRKARAGYALENHLQYLFTALGIQYSYNAVSENKIRPDFLFPSQKAYKDSSYPADLLTMLGAKTTCKDRWRQVLDEASRIEHKHLITLEPGITEDQTKQMAERKLQLVVPRQIFVSYTVQQQNWLMDVSGFLAYVMDKQKRVK